MNDRLFTLLGAGLALVLLAWLLGGSPGDAEPPLSRPRSQDAGNAGLLGLYRWLEASGVPLHRLRERYTALPEAVPGTAHLLVVAEPMVWPVRPAEGKVLRAWVERGNHVLLLSNTAHSVPWGWRQESGLGDALGLERDFLLLAEEDEPQVAGEEKQGNAEAPGKRQPDPDLTRRREACAGEALARGAIAGPQRRLRPAAGAAHPLTTDVREVHVKTPAPHGRFYQALDYRERPRHWYALLCDPQLRLPVFSAFRVGDGRVWALDYGEAFGNANLGRGDNARLFGNLAAFTLGPDGRVIFDDMHQGDSVLYDPSAFFNDRRLHGTFAFLFGMWLLWLLGYSNRYAPPAAQPPRMTGRAFVLAAGRFQARYLRPAEAARGLLRHFFNDVRQRCRLPTTGEPAWDALARASSRADAELRQLRAWHELVRQGRAVDLARLRNLILKVQDSFT